MHAVDEPGRSRLLWERDCGALPVVTDDRPIGMIMDRDIAVATATQGRPAHEIAVQEAMSSEVFACRPEDDLEDALSIMSETRVRRLPVVDNAGKLAGILSLNDVILACSSNRRGDSRAPAEALLQTLREIARHRNESEDAEVPSGVRRRTAARK